MIQILNKTQLLIRQKTLLINSVFSFLSLRRIIIIIVGGKTFLLYHNKLLFKEISQNLNISPKIMF